MIFYFSSTGNSKYAAEKIAEMNGDRLVSIGRAMKSNELHYKIGEHEDIGFVTPVYYWGIPDIVYEFLNHVRLGERNADECSPQEFRSDAVCDFRDPHGG